MGFHSSGYDHDRFVPDGAVHSNEDKAKPFVPETDAGSVYGEADEDFYVPCSSGGGVLLDNEQYDEQGFLSCAPEQGSMIDGDSVMQYESSGDENPGVFTPDTEDSEKYQLNDVLIR